MSKHRDSSRIPLPKGWPKCVRSAAALPKEISDAYYPVSVPICLKRSSERLNSQESKKWTEFWACGLQPINSP